MAFDPVDELERIEESIDLASFATLLRQFMLESSRDLGHLPKEASTWLRVATDYANGNADAAALDSVRVSAWNSIAGRDCDTSQPDVSAVRAVICVLFPDFGVNPFSYGFYFVNFSNQHEDHAENQTQLLRNLLSQHMGG